MNSRVKNALAGEGVALTAKACYQDPELVEIIASGGVDAVWICTEHRAIAPDTLYSLVQACRLGGADALVRVKPANHADVLPLLEIGVRGLMLPRVRELEEVRSLVEMMKFPPLGKRGYDGVHADARYGRMTPADYMADANRETFLVVQIEEPEVVQHIDAIAALPGVDVVFVGPGDLTLGLGKFGETSAPDVIAIIERVAAACARHGKVAGIPCAPDQVTKYRALGYRFFNIFSDYRGVTAGLAQALATARGPLKP
jgi:4-hydroxy-2-oxoheptanedioate aldolase